MWLLSLWLLFISHHPVKFSGHKSRGNKDIMFFICHVTSCVHVIYGLYDFLDNIFSSQATSLSSLVAIGLVEMEIKLFLIVMWSPDHVSKVLCDFIGSGLSPQITSGHKSCGSRDIMALGKKVDIYDYYYKVW